MVMGMKLGENWRGRKGNSTSKSCSVIFLSTYDTSNPLAEVNRREKSYDNWCQIWARFLSEKIRKKFSWRAN